MPAGNAKAKAEATVRAKARKKGLKGRRADRYVHGTMSKAMTNAQAVLAKRPRVAADY